MRWHHHVLPRPWRQPTTNEQHVIITTKTNMTRQRLLVAQVAFMSRFMILLAMAISCALLPNHQPGNDVLQFDLRWSITTTSNEGVSATDCFCLTGHVCDGGTNPIDMLTFIDPNYSVPSAIELEAVTLKNISTCAVEMLNSQKQQQRPSWINKLYWFLLNPLTRWDAARFLLLAIDSNQRYPHIVPQSVTTTTPQMFLMESSHPKDSVAAAATCHLPDDDLWIKSEQAHAFLPLMPWLIRSIALWIIQWRVPNSRLEYILPPTFEGVVVLSALLWNWVCFVVAAVALHELTYTLTIRHAQQIIMNPNRRCYYDCNNNNSNNNNSNNNNSNNNNSQTSSSSSVLRYHCQTLAYQTTFLFCFNPASVFFTTVYSESTFAMLTWTGWALWERHSFCTTTTTMSNTLPRIVRRGIAVMLWMLASYTRSNGVMIMVWLILDMMGQLLATSWRRWQKCRIGSWLWMITVLLLYGVAIGLVVLPFVWHDWRGYHIHCHHANHHTGMMVPMWCHKDNSIPIPMFGSFFFSLYQYVQRKHWNVGLFRYYEWKQIPNFILAAPVLTLSTAAAIHWIHYSWDRHNITVIRWFQSHHSRVKLFLDHMYQVFVNLCKWTVKALSEWREDDTALRLMVSKSDNHEDGKNTPILNEMDDRWNRWLLCGPLMLGYYALLALTVVLGAVVSHVQISTRLIFSSCPAIYWYLTLLGNTTRQDQEGMTRSRWICIYCLLYIVLGVLLHVNWLPWT